MIDYATNIQNYLLYTAYLINYFIYYSVNTKFNTMTTPK